jgi:hypothetical protein
MLSFLKKFFGQKPTEASPAPYKVETPVVVEATPVSAPAVKKVTKKPAAKTAATRKPRTPKV